MASAFARSDASSSAEILMPSAASISAGVQPEEMNSTLLVRVVLGVAAIVTVLVVVVFQIINLEVQTVQAELAKDVGREARAEVELAGTQKLSRYALLDAEAGTYQIPIRRAMELIASETYQRPRKDYTQEITLPTGR